jgi:hypothetical protein
MRKNRQEDSHEFLRYAVDALQKSCLAGLPLCVLIAVFMIRGLRFEQEDRPKTCRDDLGPQNIWRTSALTGNMSIVWSQQ